MSIELTREEIVAKLRGIVAGEGDVAIEIISEKSRLKADLAFDSLATVETVMVIEEDFDIEFPETGDADDATVGEIADVILECLQKKVSA